MERIDAQAFEGERLRRPGKVAVDFSADWCPFCRHFLPDFQALDGNAPFGVLLADLTDEDSPLWETFRIDVVPTIVAFRDGRPVFRADGVLGEGLSAGSIRALREALA